MTHPSEKILEHWDDLEYAVGRSIRYHYRRRRFFENWHRLTSASAVIFGSATVASLISTTNSRIALWLAALVAVLGAIDLIVGTSRQAWLHADLAKRFFGLEKELNNSQKTEAELIRLKNLRLDIEMEEPPVLHVLNKICDNDMVRAMGYKDSELLVIKWYQRLAAPYLDISPQTIRRRRELDAQV
jgi:hypothetical protein